MDNLEEFHYFTTAVYAIKKPEFLSPIKQITEEYLWARSDYMNSNSHCHHC